MDEKEIVNFLIGMDKNVEQGKITNEKINKLANFKKNK